MAEDYFAAMQRVEQRLEIVPVKEKDVGDVKVLELLQLVERLEMPELCYEERIDVASQLRQALSRVNEHPPPRDYGMLGEGI